jgi:glycosyltransferase involved in cell wall biosynthesis
MTQGDARERHAVDGSPMKRVAMIAYYFPPDGSAGVYRPLRFARTLPRYGWQPSVVTVDTDVHPRYDSTLTAAVPKSIEIVRVADRDLWRRLQATREKRLRARLQAASPQQRAETVRAQHRLIRSIVRQQVRRVEAALYYPDYARFWIKPAVTATVDLCRRTRPHALFVTGGPWSAFLVAQQASARAGVPFVLDFRDSWTLTRNDDFESLRPRWAMRRDRLLLRRLFAAARSVIFRYESEAQCYWQAYSGALTRSKIHIIPNGFEGAIDTSPLPGGERCVVLYTGTAVPYRYETLLEGLSMLQARHPREAAQLHVLFVGEGCDDVRAAAASLGVSGLVETRPPVSAREVERLQRDAHALLLLGVKPYQGYELCGSKVFGYLRAGRPIVGILPADESRRVLERVGVSTIADIEAPEQIVSILRQVLASWSTGGLPSLIPNAARCDIYESAYQTRALASALDGGPALTPFVPGLVDLPASLRHAIGSEGWLSTA